MVVGLTRKGATPLLRTVGGKRHASDENHEELAHKTRPNETGSLLKEELDKALNAEPMSSDEELQVPARPAQTPKPNIPAPKTRADASRELKQPRQRHSDRRRPAIRRPANGSYQNGKADKTKRGLDEDKENASTTTTPRSSTDSANEIPFGIEFAGQAPSKNARGYGSKSRPGNIHLPVQKKARYGSSRGASRVKATSGHVWDMKPRPQTEDSYSDVSMEGHDTMDDKELENILGPSEVKADNSELRTKSARKKSSIDGGNLKTSTIEDNELRDLVGIPDKLLDDPELRPVNVKTKRIRIGAKAKSSALDPDELDDVLKPPPLLDQLGNWMQNQAPLSSQPASSAPQEELDNIQDYIRQLPKEEIEGSVCALCKESVELEDYWEFWKGKDKTVKNHTAFCNAHRRKSAQEEYEREGYPAIYWNALPKRIRKHRMKLYQILNNDRSSEHRDRYEPLALTGKAAAVPSRRKDLSEDVQKELDSYALDDNATYPGYYGPRGRRAITESVMKVLKNEIKNCKDAVVQASGPAAFIQAVLVPETAILLIMDDCKVDRDGAEEIREKTYDMGLLLNEEIEDMLDVQEDSDDDNEYHRR